MVINILAGGPQNELPNLRESSGEDGLWVGVDRGVFTLLSMGIPPVSAFGDFDSVTEEEFEFIQSKVKNLNLFQPEKDEPDMELALDWALEQSPRKIRVFGATGGRLDHFFSNIQLLLRTVMDKSSPSIEIIDKQNTITAVQPGTHKIMNDPGKKYISFIPQTTVVKGLSLSGFKYPLTKHDIPRTSTLCISNELIADSGTFSFTEGILLVIRSSD